jgi:hypothetical protein
VSYTESKISARAGLSASPVGAGTVRTILSSSSRTPSPVFAETRSTSPGSQPMMWAISPA